MKSISFGRMCEVGAIAILLIGGAGLVRAQAPVVAGLPEPVVKGIQSQVPQSGPTGPTYSQFTVSSPTTGPVSTAGSPYNVWCFNPYGSIQPPPTPQTYAAYSSYDPNFLKLSGAGSAVAWQEINWVINHKHGENNNLNPSVMDIQYVIWDLLVHGYNTTALTADGAKLLADAQTYGPGFIPKPGQLLAVALYTNGINPNDGPADPQDIFVEYPLPANPYIKLKKTASVSTAKCTDKVTYSYTVTNTGNVTLTNITVTDDNGTPKNPADDFVAGVIASLAPNQSVTLTKTIYLPVTESFLDAWGNVSNHTLIKQVLPTGDIQVTLLEDTNLIDNSYGPSASPDWGSGNALWNHVGADSAEFVFTDGAGNTVLDFAADYLSLSPQNTLGLATAGINGGAGRLYYGNAANVSSISTTLSDNLGAAGSNWTILTNSPPPSNPAWKFQCGYTVVIKQGAFGKNGFGDCKIKTIQHGKCKFGNNYQCHPTPVCTGVTNTAVAKAVFQGVTYTATAQATVQEVVTDQKSCTPPPAPKCPPTPCRPQDWWNKCSQQWQQCRWW